MLDDPAAALIEEEARKARASGDLTTFAEKVIANALGIAARERELAPELDASESERLADRLGHGGDLAALNAELARRIREGMPTSDALLEHLILTTIGKLQVDQPTYPGFRALSER
ncbi:hypothetical protein A6F68_01121 [Tsuneonella dongtanensis]|uniref:DUF6285 domain-containing protein n=1 Tax=Tsuneonella dongtanensis TaxID=692370 RepID=A0A1B2ABV2_9SPHN|nr:DUF6285 domain-containing protein [Tsuneonella dongtanensis]ANY19640.1 hypothetical protein A6F68_01121 [Tsuneonella dongtanensis]